MALGNATSFQKGCMNEHEVRPLRAAVLSPSDSEPYPDEKRRAPAPRRKRGRPLLMAPEAVLERIRQTATRADGLFRVHLEQPALYARARRLFGSWSAAVEAAGLDYGAAVEKARIRSLHTRKVKSRKRP